MTAHAGSSGLRADNELVVEELDFELLVSSAMDRENALNGDGTEGQEVDDSAGSSDTFAPTPGTDSKVSTPSKSKVNRRFRQKRLLMRQEASKDALALDNTLKPGVLGRHVVHTKALKTKLNTAKLPHTSSAYLGLRMKAEEKEKPVLTLAQLVGPQFHFTVKAWDGRYWTVHWFLSKDGLMTQ